MTAEIEKSTSSGSTEAATKQPGSPYSISRRFLSFPVVLSCSLAYLVFILSRRDIADPDLWWHLRNAQHLLTTGHLPVVDAYSFTVPGASVVPFEWLSELAYYFAYKWAGLSAVFLLVFLLCTAIVLGVFRLSFLASSDVKNSFVVTVGAVILASVSIGARTLLFGWLYLVILLLVLAAFRKNSSNWLWTIPPLFCLWVNSHGSWPMGIVVFGMFIASGMVEGRRGHVVTVRWSTTQLRQLLIAAGASAAAVFVNPLGYRLVLYPFQAMFGTQSGIYMSAESASIDFHTSWGTVAMILILGTLPISVLSLEEWGLDELGYTALALYFSLTYVRFIFLAGILLAPIFARRVKLMLPYSKKSDKPLYNCVALAILLTLFIASVPSHSNFQNVVKYPEGAVSYMKANGLRGRGFHDWVWGGYLIWNAPELKVFIDGRGDPYGPTGVFKDYWAAVSNDHPQTVLDKYGIDYVLLPAGSPLANSLKESPAWTLQYSDETSVLLHRSHDAKATSSSRPWMNLLVS